ncbi:hypothetical protein LSH36_722g01045 [Paralvinella palmiformis]|uniref:Ig-like domain-containing protein n=1 Tax=Paralvinella palmiformis TaxID=53620 RepID=A0AAD9J2K1_9ANNE|nr:hypothetical protein LSH36_722g01045 [Paralvinella palmiformis]
MVGVNPHARVTIDSAQPLYVEYGQNLTLICTSDNSRQLMWTEETRETAWRKQPIEPVLGGRYITRYTVEKPTRHVSSTLIKKEMTLTDRGTYECKDATEENSFGLYITVIYIATEDVRANVKGEAVYLYCSIRGFDTNIPFLDYHWYYKEQTIMTNHKYDIVSKEGALQLTINEPGKLSDTKLCHFTL